MKRKYAMKQLWKTVSCKNEILKNGLKCFLIQFCFCFSVIILIPFKTLEQRRSKLYVESSYYYTCAVISRLFTVETQTCL